MNRAIDLYFCDFNSHVDLSFLDASKISIRRTSKGEPTPSGKGKLPFNVVSIEYADSDNLPDEYDLRIQTMIEAVGGESTVKKLVSKYQARISAITMGLPCRSTDWVEDGYISCEMMKKLSNLGLELHFYYT